MTSFCFALSFCITHCWRITAWNRSRAQADWRTGGM